jgi:hypothetical protein
LKLCTEPIGKLGEFVHQLTATLESLLNLCKALNH